MSSSQPLLKTNRQASFHRAGTKLPADRNTVLVPRDIPRQPISRRNTSFHSFTPPTNHLDLFRPIRNRPRNKNLALLTHRPKEQHIARRQASWSERTRPAGTRARSSQLEPCPAAVILCDALPFETSLNLPRCMHAARVKRLKRVTELDCHDRRTRREAQKGCCARASDPDAPQPACPGMFHQPRKNPERHMATEAR